MKKIIILMIAVTLLMTSCTSQKNMNPMLFFEKFKSDYPEFIINDEGLYCDDSSFICFLSDKNNHNYVIKIYCDSFNNIKKVCLACDNASKAADIRYVTEAIIKTYAPDESYNEVMNKILIGERDYFRTQWYRYSSVINNETVFFSVENIKMSTESDAELTLRPDDITSRE